jgi:hypothetical protein
MAKSIEAGRGSVQPKRLVVAAASRIDASQQRGLEDVRIGRRCPTLYAKQPFVDFRS